MDLEKERKQGSRERLSSSRSEHIKHIDYSPTIFLRCHSKKNDTADKTTGVWKCAFQPLSKYSGSKCDSNTVFATCGGNSVCVINAEDGSVMTKHYSKDLNEDFTAMAWTSFNVISHGTINILAVAGRKSVLHLLHPDKAVCFAEHVLRKTSLSSSRRKVGEFIESMIFHPDQPNILFGVFKCATWGEIYVWDIGNPHPPEYTSSLVLLQTFHSEFPGTALTFSSYCNMLLCGTERGVIGWLCPVTSIKKKDKFEEQIFKFPYDSKNLAPEDENFVDSIVAIGNGKMIATKCALHGYIYLWDLDDALKKQTRIVIPLHTLNWSTTDNYYMNIGINARATVLACGDDRGVLWVYNIKEILALPSQDHDCSNMLEWPQVRDLELVKQKKLFFNDSDIVVNQVALNHDGTYLVAVTSTNTVCIWKNPEI